LGDLGHFLRLPRVVDLDAQLVHLPLETLFAGVDLARHTLKNTRELTERIVAHRDRVEDAWSEGTVFNGRGRGRYPGDLLQVFELNIAQTLAGP
jgi:hypothetical protein